MPFDSFHKAIKHFFCYLITTIYFFVNFFPCKNSLLDNIQFNILQEIQPFQKSNQSFSCFIGHQTTTNQDKQSFVIPFLLTYLLWN